MRPFTLGKLPKIDFGPGKIADLPRLMAETAKTALLITGASPFHGAEKWQNLTDGLKEWGVAFFHETITGEPSPDQVDEIAGRYRDRGLGMVVSIGGGSVMDAGKAISAMIPKTGSVRQYLEGFPDALVHDGVKIPFIAVPTTAGTGSEATKNAVLSQTGPGGFKRSIRHDHLTPDMAVVDPELALSCPPPVTAACGMDAFVQLLESFVSTNANELTDAMALSGMAQVRDCLAAVYADGGNLAARSGMAYAALLSGITLSHAGLGVVHGFASVLGGFFNIPHGVICGVLIGPATRVTIQYLKDTGGDAPFLEKYARVGAILANREYVPENRDDHLDFLARQLDAWANAFRLPRLGALGVGFQDAGRILPHVGTKNHPVALDRAGLKEILLSCL